MNLVRKKLVTALKVVVISLVASLSVKASDTLRFMMYNLTYYGVNSGSCTSSNNGLTNKDAALRVILNSYQPDILSVNEIAPNNAVQDRIVNLLNGLNLGQTYQRVPFVNNSFSSLVNGTFFNSTKLALKSIRPIPTNTRVCDHVVLYYRSNTLAQGDTVFLNLIICHLKAGNTESDVATRGDAANTLINYLNTNQIKGNVILAGDLNTYRSTELGFSRLINNPTFPAYRLVDPLNLVGEWQNNVAIARHHTQSTQRLSSANPCFSGGGMDDRFDVILINKHLEQDSGKVALVRNSYIAYGNNGNVLNQSINVSSNTILPSNVLNALAACSDHIPVVAKFRIDAAPLSVSGRLTQSSVEVGYLSNTNQLIFKGLGENTKHSYYLVDMTGRLIIQSNLGVNENSALLAEGLSNGLYQVVVQELNNPSILKRGKLIIVR